MNLRIKKTSLCLFILIFAAVYIKFVFFPIKLGDYKMFLQPWVEFIQSNGYFHALQYNFYDYTPSYIYILVVIAKLCSLLDVEPLYFIKIVSVLFEYLIAFFIGKIAEMKYPNKGMMWLSMLIIPLLPTVLLNGAVFSQCDSIYTAFAIGGLYFALKDKSWLSILFLSISMTFKAQAVMILPFFFVWLLRGHLKWYQFILVPIVYLISLAPAWIAGRPLSDLLLVYMSQANVYRMLSMNFPNFYIFLDNQYYDILTLAGMALTALAVFIAGLVLANKKYAFDFDQWIRLAFAGAVIVPFLLPGMHERYMYMGDVLGVLYFLVIGGGGGMVPSVGKNGFSQWELLPYLLYPTPVICILKYYRNGWYSSSMLFSLFSLYMISYAL